MSEPQNSDCLSFGDALFLHLERHGSPLHVASICIFDGVITLEECMAHIASKLPMIPRYLQHVVPAPFGVGMPIWQFDPDFDIHNHVREIKLKRGTENELQKVASEILSHRLDREKPLWEFVLISGMRGKRTAMLVRVHHCLADGVAGVGMLNVVMDTDPMAKVKAPGPPPKPAPPPKDQATLLLDGLVTGLFSTLERVLTMESQVLRMAHEVVTKAPVAMNSNGNASQSAIQDELAALLPEFGSPPDRLPFNVVCKGPQSFEWAELPFSEIRAIKHACGGTVNDVVLSLISMTIRRYAQEKGVSTGKRILRIIVPVNVRTEEQANGYGNQITFVPVTVPLGVKQPEDLLEAVHTRMEVIKKLRLAEMASLAGTILGTIPTALQIVAGPIASQLPLAVCNLICTNVPGPKVPLYFLGHEMLTCYPYVPIGGEMGMNCAILTYNGKAFFGFTGDVYAIPDLKLLPQFLHESFAEMKAAVGVSSRKAVSKRPKKKAPPPEVKEPGAEEKATEVVEEKLEPVEV